jgi:hypothetical protein
MRVVCRHGFRRHIEDSYFVFAGLADFDDGPAALNDAVVAVAIVYLAKFFGRFLSIVRADFDPIVFPLGLKHPGFPYRSALMLAAEFLAEPAPLFAVRATFKTFHLFPLCLVLRSVRNRAPLIGHRVRNSWIGRGAEHCAILGGWQPVLSCISLVCPARPAVYHPR